MTEQQTKLIKTTWATFQKIDPLLVGGVFYEKLFSDHPSFRRMFSNTKETQSEKIIAMLNYIVSHIETIEELSESLKNLAARHLNYGVKPEYYRSVGIALLWMLQQGLGSDWDNEVREAWTACYNTISGIMLEAANVN